MFNPFSKPKPKEQIRENEKALRKVGRELDREKRELEREEKKLELEIKKLAEKGNKAECAILAKQLIQLRKQKTRIYGAGSKVQSVGLQNKTMGTTMRVAGAMNTSSKVMADMNKILKPQQVAMDMDKFKKASHHLELTDEMIEDTMDDILADSGDEEESDRIITQVLDEIGIEVSGKMRQAPTPASGVSTVSETDKELLEKLEKLKS